MHLKEKTDAIFFDIVKDYKKISRNKILGNGNTGTNDSSSKMMGIPQRED